jgi:drug/metabolite transporter (DMT)-like permease
VTCRATFLPVSGYPAKARKSPGCATRAAWTGRLRADRGTGLYAPLTATIATQIGPVRIRDAVRGTGRVHAGVRIAPLTLPGAHGDGKHMSEIAASRAPDRKRFAATLIGFSAVLMWALLALFTAASGAVPPFQLSAMCFAVGAVIGFAATAGKRSRDRERKAVPWQAYALGIGGLFGYHFLYFTALRHAPAVEASLICYLWPMLIVTGSALMPGERLGWHHLVGVACGFAGTALIVTGGEGFSLKAEYAYGYGVAIAAAFTWSAYSLLSRRFSAVPTAIVAWYCLATAILSLLAHLTLETTVWPQTAAEWAAVAALGALPVGAAFYVWDHGVKHGDIQVLGASSYAAPLISTIILILAGQSDATWAIAIACLLITGGAAIAAKDLLLQRRRRNAAV